MLRSTSSPGHRGPIMRRQSGVAPDQSHRPGSYGVGFVSSPHEHRQRPVRTNNSRIASPVAVSVDAGSVAIHVRGTPLVFSRWEKLSTWGRRYGEEVIEEKGAALRRTPISESQGARIKIRLDECMHERVDGYMNRWDTVST